MHRLLGSDERWVSRKREIRSKGSFPKNPKKKWPQKWNLFACLATNRRVSCGVPKKRPGAPFWQSTLPVGLVWGDATAGAFRWAFRDATGASSWVFIKPGFYQTKNNITFLCQ